MEMCAFIRIAMISFHYTPVEKKPSEARTMKNIETLYFLSYSFCTRSKSRFRYILKAVIFILKETYLLGLSFNAFTLFVCVCVNVFLLGLSF